MEENIYVKTEGGMFTIGGKCVKPFVLDSPTDLVPLAAVYSGSDYYYCKNFTTPTAGGSTTWTANFKNLNVSDRTKLSFQLGGDLGNPIVGGVYSYESYDRAIIDYSGMSTARPYRMGVAMFGPSSYITGSDRPQIVALVANTTNNAASAANIQIGGHCTSNTHFEFDTPLTSNLYGVYGFVSNLNSGNLYGGAIVRTYTMNASGFNFNIYAANGNSAFNNANFQMVVIQ